MEPGFFGTEEVTEEDRAYGGSRFSEVREAVFANPYQKVWGSAGEPPLPIYDVTLPSAVRGILPLGSPYFFRQAVAPFQGSGATVSVEEVERRGGAALGVARRDVVGVAG
jgi:hypothetical protein